MLNAVFGFLSLWIGISLFCVTITRNDVPILWGVAGAILAFCGINLLRHLNDAEDNKS